MRRTGISILLPLLAILGLSAVVMTPTASYSCETIRWLLQQYTMEQLVDYARSIGIPESTIRRYQRQCVRPQ